MLGRLLGRSPLLLSDSAMLSAPSSAHSAISEAVSHNLSPEWRVAVGGAPGATEGTGMRKGSRRPRASGGRGRGDLRERAVRQRRATRGEERPRVRRGTRKWERFCGERQKQGGPIRVFQPSPGLLAVPHLSSRGRSGRGRFWMKRKALRLWRQADGLPSSPRPGGRA